MSLQHQESFKAFPLLPPEIRLQVWETIALEPNTVEISLHSQVSPQSSTCQWISPSKVPVLFRICSESREVALQRYSTLETSPEQMRIPWPKVYINFEIDTLWLRSPHVLWAKDLLKRNEQLKSNLRSLIVDETTWEALNPVFHARGLARSRAPIGLLVDGAEGVRSGLRALERLSFRNE